MQGIPDKLLKIRWLKEWHQPDLLEFIRTGSAALLAKVPRIPNQHGWALRDVFPDPSSWTSEADNLLSIIVRDGMSGGVTNWLDQFCRYLDADWEQFHPALNILRKAGVDESWIETSLRESNFFDVPNLKITPSGHLLLSYDDNRLLPMLGRHLDLFAAAVAASDPERLQRLMGSEWKTSVPRLRWDVIVRVHPDFHSTARQHYVRSLSDYRLLKSLSEVRPELYRDWAISELHHNLNDPTNTHHQGSSILGLLEILGEDALPELIKWSQFVQNEAPSEAVRNREWFLEVRLKEFVFADPGAIAEAMSRSEMPEVSLAGLKACQKRGVTISDAESASRVSRILKMGTPEAVYEAINLVEGRACDLLAGELWLLTQHKSAVLRGAAARALSGLGWEAVQGNALKLLNSKKSEHRQTAVALVQRVGGEAAGKALKARLDEEESDAVRDVILLALESSGGVSFTDEERASRMAKTLGRARGCPVAWLAPAALRLVRTDGTALTSDEVLYLLVRQSRCGEMRADIEARPLLSTLDRKACGASALEMLERFLASPQEAGDRWVVALAALCGDDRLIPTLHKAILTWAENARGKLAEYGAGALALLGSDAALTVLESLTVRFRSKNKNIDQAAGDAFAAAAEARGVTVEELGDLVVPWLGFEPGVRRVLSCGQQSWELWIGPDFKPVYKDLKTGKKVNKLPAAAGPALLDEQKAFAAGLKEAVKAQVLRMETLLVRQFRWPVARWLQLYPVHPLLRPFAEQLIWCHHPEDGGPFTAFRYTGDGSMTTVSGGTFELPASGGISLLHPLALSEPDKSAWEDHLADYEVMPPFPQLRRPVFRCPEAEASATRLQTVAGTELNAMTFRGRAERLGWVRGSVCDGGVIFTYRKVFSGTGVDAFLDLDGMAVGIGLDGSVTLGAAWFVKSGTVKIGSYVYDEPSGDADPRLLPAGSVPPVAWSEVMADLYKISGTEQNDSQPHP